MVRWPTMINMTYSATGSDRVARPSRVLVSCDDPVEGAAIQAGLRARLSCPVHLLTDPVPEGDEMRDAVLVVSLDPLRRALSVPSFPGMHVIALVDSGAQDQWPDGEHTLVLERPIILSRLAASLAALLGLPSGGVAMETTA